MLRKYIARLLAFALVLNLVLCVPLSVAAEETDDSSQTTFDADPVTIDTVEQTVTVTEDAQYKSTSQTVSVEIPTNTALSQTPVDGSIPTATEKPVETAPPEGSTPGDSTQGGTTGDPSDDNTTEDNTKTEPVIEYNAPAEGAPEETVHVEESFDLDVTLNKSNTTDVQYEISLDQKTTTTSETNGTTQETTEIVENVDQTWNEDSPAPELTVNMSVNGMKYDPTRVEHIYTTKNEQGEEVSHTEYYYNEANGKDETDTSKKYFTVIKETTENAVNKVVSLVTNFLGIFNITNNAFENQTTKAMSSTLSTAVKNAGEGDTVEMLRNTSSGTGSSISSSNDVTVDLKGHTYECTNSQPTFSAVRVNNSNQKLTIKNGTIESKGYGIRSMPNMSGNTIVLDGVTLKTNTAGKSGIAIWDYGNNNTYEIKNSTIDNTGGGLAITHNGSYGGAKFSIIGSYINADGSTKLGIYVSGNANSAKNTLTISDSVVGGAYSAVEVKHTDVTIDNSTLTSFAEAGSYEPNSSGTTTVGAALAVTGNCADESRGTIVINSGHFKGAKDFATIFHSVEEATGDQNATITLNGGRFVNAAYLYKYTDANHAVISSNDGSDYPYAVVGADAVPARPGYNFLGYKDDKGNDITLKDAIATKTIAYAQWEEIVEPPTPEDPVDPPTPEDPVDPPIPEDPVDPPIPEDPVDPPTPEKPVDPPTPEKPVDPPTPEKPVDPPTTDDPVETPTTEAPAQTPTAEAPKDTSFIIVEADTKDNNVDVAIQGSTAVVTVSTPAGEADAVSEVTIPSIADLQEQGVKKVKVQVEKNVTLELGVAKNDKTVADSVKITREEEKLVITDSNKSEIVIHVEELKAVATKPVSIKLDSGVLTVNLGNGAYKLNVKDALATSKSLTVKLENGVLKLYDSKGNLIEEIKI